MINQIFDKIKHLLLPFLIAIYPMLFLYKNNIGISYNQDLFFIFFINVFITLIVFYLSNLIFKNAAKACLFAFFFNLIFFYSGFFIDYLVLLEPFEIRIFRWRFIMPLLIIFIVFFFIRLYQTKKERFEWLNYFILPFLLLNFYQIYKIYEGINECNILIAQYKDQNDLFLKQNFHTISVDNIEDFPNIYFIILDCYPSRETLIKYVKYDNIEFLDWLKKKGFILPERTFSNYYNTLYSISSSLNMTYHNLGEHVKSNRYFYALSDYMIRNNNLAKFLRIYGYNWVHVASSWPFTSEPPYTAKIGKVSIVNFLKQGWKISYFIGGYLTGTLIGPFFQRFISEPAFRNVILSQLSQLKNSVHLKGKNFIFAHIVCPHPPYLFDENGNHISMGYDDNLRAGQIKFINKKIQSVVEYILKKSNSAPIIILQSDHGMGLAGNHQKMFTESPNELKEKFKVAFSFFSAYYLPVETKKLIYSSISPVNNFRLIFDHYFNSKFGLLEDHSFIEPIVDGGPNINVDKWFKG